MITVNILMGDAAAHLTDTQTLKRLVKEFATKEVAPRVAQYDREERLPADLLEQLGQLGFLGGTVPIQYGGAGLDNRTLVALLEEMASVCQIMATLMSMPSGLVGASILRYGTEEQKNRWLRPLALGHVFGAAAVTEPYSGSDVAGMKTTYRRDGSGFIISGSKAWISNLDIAEFFVTFATRDPSLRHRGITAFVVPRSAAGLSMHPYTDKLGFRPICTGDLVLEDVRVDADQVLGHEGEGFRVAMTAVERGRLGVAARGVGVARACLDAAVRYAKDREIFGGPIARFQLVQSKITDMVVGVESARALTDIAAAALDAGRASRRETSIAKMYATDVAMRAATDAVQIHGAYGISPEFPVGRYFRDAKVLQIVEGSNDLHRALIAEMVLGMRSDGDVLSTTGDGTDVSMKRISSRTLIHGDGDRLGRD